MQFKAVIFDMDGLLIDSEFYWAQAELEFLKTYNIPRTRELTAKMTGRSLHETAVMLKNEYNLTDSVEEILGNKIAKSQAIYDYQAQAMPGSEELLKSLKQSGFVVAIASGSSLERIMKIVSRLGWEKYFNALVSTDHVNLKGKPDPAIYTYTSEVIKIEPGKCVVLEDSVNGVRSAKAAGMSCAAVLDARWSWGDFSEADVIVNSLEEQRLIEFIGL